MTQAPSDANLCSEPRWQHIKFLRLGSSAEVAAFTRTFKDELQAQTQ